MLETIVVMERVEEWVRGEKIHSPNTKNSLENLDLMSGTDWNKVCGGGNVGIKKRLLFLR